jgi:translation elongation factor EF-Tu-like GTPase
VETWNLSRVKTKFHKPDIAATMFSLDLVKPHLERLLSNRQFPKTICPSEAARAMSADEVEQSGAANWRGLMPAIQSYAFDLRDQGRIDIFQRGQVLVESQTLENTRRPIRLRKR